jgi:hypothetical protein
MPRLLPPPYGEPREPPALPLHRHEGIVLPPPATSEPWGQISIRRHAPHPRVPKPEPHPDPESETLPRWTAYLNYHSDIRALDDHADTPGFTRTLKQSKAEEEDDKWWSSDDEDDVILRDVELSYQA